VDGAQGVLTQPEWVRGCEHTSARRRATSATTIRGKERGEAHTLSRSREAETRRYVGPPFAGRSSKYRLTCDARSCRSNPPGLPAGESVQAVFDAGPYGDPVQERWRPGGSVLAIIGQGSQAYLSLPPGCVGVSYTKAKQQGSHQSWGLREDQADGREIGESRGNGHPTLASERPSGDGVCRRM